MFLLWISSGLRREEVLGLNKENIDFGKRMIVPLAQLKRYLIPPRILNFK